jgi:hypothetical protein
MVTPALSTIRSEGMRRSRSVVRIDLLFPMSERLM